MGWGGRVFFLYWGDEIRSSGAMENGRSVGWLVFMRFAQSILQSTINRPFKRRDPHIHHKRQFQFLLQISSSVSSIYLCM